ncbi:MAG TPA: hypothetical protein PLV85_05895, partial [Polyangiaceae bacterium]|nr:hypothetical protein [Polyangiaceae bacterium]
SLQVYHYLCERADRKSRCQTHRVFRFSQGWAVPTAEKMSTRLGKVTKSNTKDIATGAVMRNLVQQDHADDSFGPLDDVGHLRLHALTQSPKAQQVAPSCRHEGARSFRKDG